MFTSQFFPDATLEQMASFNELQRRSASPKQAAKMLLANQSLDATGVLNQVRCPTLVSCATGDARVPIEEARLVAASIPDARFVPLESNNHVPLAGEPAFQRLFDELSAFLPNSAETGNGHNVIGRLTPRERQVFDLIARGCDNLQIAAHLGMAEKTVRNHITSIFDKIAVESRAQAIVLARDTGLGRT